MKRNPAFGGRLKRAIDASPLDQKRLAEVLGVREATVTAWVKGTPPKGEHLLRLPGMLGVNGHWLLTGEGDMRLPEGDEGMRLHVIGRIANGELDARALSVLRRGSPEAIGDALADLLEPPSAGEGP